MSKKERERHNFFFFFSETPFSFFLSLFQHDKNTNSRQTYHSRLSRVIQAHKTDVSQINDVCSLFFTILFFFVESIIRLIVTILPRFIIHQLDAGIKTQVIKKIIVKKKITLLNAMSSVFPWIAHTEQKAHVSPLEKASSFEKMVTYW